MGAGRRVFSPGEVLTASNTMNYLMDQAVMNFAGTAARGSAIGSAVSEGMVTYLADTNSVEVYTGSAWNPISQIQSPNYIINGGFDIWQRGTSFSGNNYAADRWYGGNSPSAIARSTDVPNGFTYSIDVTGANHLLGHRVESTNAVALRDKTITVSFYAKSSSGTNTFVAAIGTPSATDNFAISNIEYTSSAFTLTSSWARYEVTFAALSADIAKGLFIYLYRNGSTGTDRTLITGVQLEAGSTATPFRRNANSIQGELAACQRYFQVYGNSPNGNFTVQSGIGTSFSTSQSVHVLSFDTPMRTTPSLTSSTASTFQVDLVGVTSSPVSNISFDLMTENMTRIVTTFTTNGSFGSHKAVVLAANNSSNARIYASAEL